MHMGKKHSKVISQLQCDEPQKYPVTSVCISLPAWQACVHWMCCKRCGNNYVNVKLLEIYPSLMCNFSLPCNLIYMVNGKHSRCVCVCVDRQVTGYLCLQLSLSKHIPRFHAHTRTHTPCCVKDNSSIQTAPV